MAAAHVNDKNFQEEVLQSPLPVLVDFWAEWCGPCRMIAPIIDQLADELQGKIKVAKVNVDEAQELAMKFGVMSIPTLLIFKGGKISEQFVGALSKEQLLSKMNPYIK
ncbi:MAG: thioredoxin [Candidatus Omnitrophota bacterium]